MDAFAVALATGIRLCVVNRRQSFRLSFHFGLFQFFMPVVGWFFGLSLREYIEAWDHWLAFVLLCFVGGKMIWEAFEKDDEQADAVCVDPTKGLSLILLSFATSVDALAVGLSLALLGAGIWAAAISIGIVCAVLTFVGLQIGRMVSGASILATRAELAGGLVLLGIGLKILYEHGVFN